VDRIPTGKRRAGRGRSALKPRPLKVVILAGGQGTRMKSSLPKVLHPVAGRPMVGYVVDAVRALEPGLVVVVVGYRAETVRAYLGDGLTYALQEPQLGTGHAFMVAQGALGTDEADLLLLYGDIPLVRPGTLRGLLDRHRATGAAATILTTVPVAPTGYGRVVRDPDSGRVRGIVEEADATLDERAIREVNTGIYCFKVPEVLPLLDRLTAANRQKELYLPDLIAIMAGQGDLVETLVTPDPGEVEGVNLRSQLARAEARCRADILDVLMRSGVTVVDPASTYVDWGVEIGPDTVLEPGTILRGRTRIGRDCVIGPWSQLVDTVVADGCRVWASVLEASELEPGASVGPFSHLRAGVRVGREARVGNFVELKNTAVGRGAKVPHHSYVGDADIGAEANIGAGVVVVNYDGLNKHRTRVGDAAFVGCNTNLIAPVQVGDGAYTAAGSTVTLDVPPGSLAVARSGQRNLEGWVDRRRPGTRAAHAARQARERASGRPGPSVDKGAQERTEE
jgi:bifunctional UDP-N-acetylglucosamine pyrophosphorylase/glucosamine-1-phosphate N-acetyltransferase